MQKEFIVENLKTRLDKFLAEMLAEISRSQIQRDIESGQVEVNGELISESKFVVRQGDKVVYKVESKKLKVESLKSTNTPLKILYNNHGFLIIDKPAGMVVHPGAGFKRETLASALLYQFKNIHLVGEEHRPGIVHRLDKDTSGVILVATTQEMYEHLKNAFAERKIKKEYIALVLGKVEKLHGFIQAPIGKSKTDFRKQTTKNPVEAKEAITEYKVLEYLTPHPSGVSAGHLLPQGEKGNKKSGATVDTYSLLLVRLHTGRTHQIRVHLSSIGHPLIEDELYGGRKIRLQALNRQFLHAKKIEVRLPDGTWIEAESELTDDLKQVLKNLHSKLVNQL